MATFDPNYFKRRANSPSAYANQKSTCVRGACEEDSHTTKSIRKVNTKKTRDLHTKHNSVQPPKTLSPEDNDLALQEAKAEAFRGTGVDDTHPTELAWVNAEIRNIDDGISLPRPDDLDTGITIDLRTKNPR